MPTQYFYLSSENMKIGPIVWAVLEQLHHAGTIGDDTLTAPENASEWIPFRDLKIQREKQASLPPVPKGQPRSADMGRPRIIEEKAKWLKNLIPDKVLTKARREMRVVGIAVGIAFVVTLVGYTAFSFIRGERSSSHYEDPAISYEEPLDQNAVSPALPRFNSNLSAQEMNDLYARPGSSLPGGSLNRGSGTTQESMDDAMRNAANAFGTGDSAQGQNEARQQNPPPALSTYGAKPRQYRNFQGEVRTFIGPPPAGWTPLNY